MRGVLAGLAALVMLGGASAGQALTFKEGGDESMNCMATFEGTFEPGDADRMKRFLDGWWAKHKETYQYNMPRLSICLNSRGGSLSEAVKMADALVLGGYHTSNLGTAVPAGAVNARMAGWELCRHCGARISVEAFGPPSSLRDSV